MITRNAKTSDGVSKLALPGPNQAGRPIFIHRARDTAILSQVPDVQPQWNLHVTLRAGFGTDLQSQFLNKKLTCCSK